MTIADPSTIDASSIEDRANRTQLAIGRKQDPPRSASTMTATEAARLREVAPTDPVELPAQQLPCAACGVATAPPRVRAALIRVPRFVQRADGTAGPRTGDVLLTRCNECEDRRQLALRIAADHPRASAQLGNVVVDVIERALIRLHILGRPLPEPDVSDAELGSLIRTMGSFGGSITWQSRAGEHPGECSPRPWGWLRQADRARVQRAWLDHFAETMKMTRPPVAVPPPSPSGDGLQVAGACFCCGVDHVDVPALRAHRLGGPETAARAVWTPVDVAAVSVGAPPEFQRLSGHLCPACAAAKASAGAVGPTAVEIAVQRHLRDVGRPDLAERERIIEWDTPAFATLVARARQHGQAAPVPCSEPWAFIDFEAQP